MRSLNDISNDIMTQDNRGTAAPMLILLQVKKEYVAHPEYNSGTDTVYVETVSGDFHREETEDGIKEWLKEYYSDDEEFYPEEGKHYDTFEMGHHWETENVFFTDKGYEEHMALNGHNYKKGQVRSYGIHAFRNPEMLKVLGAIHGEQ